jgi:hypothetical protein
MHDTHRSVEEGVSGQTTEGTSHGTTHGDHQEWKVGSNAVHNACDWYESTNNTMKKKSTIKQQMKKN